MHTPSDIVPPIPTLIETETHSTWNDEINGLVTLLRFTDLTRLPENIKLKATEILFSFLWRLEHEPPSAAVHLVDAFSVLIIGLAVDARLLM